jgi:hypothetical protein
LRIRLGLLACLLAGCAAQPTRSTPSDAPIAASAALSDTHAVVRIGLEFLPPDERFPDPAPVLAEPSADAAVRPPISAGRRAIQPIELRREAPSTTPDLATIDLEAIEDPVARETMNFCSDLIAADRLRVRREVGLPFFDFRFDEPGVAPLLTSERRLRQDHERWSQQQAKVTLDLPLTGRVRFGLRARTDYETGRSTVRSDLIYRASPRTSFHLAAGDDMDFLSTSSLYSLFDSPMDGAPGLVMYAVHTF